MKKMVLFQLLLVSLAVLCCATNGWSKTVTLSWDASPSPDVVGYKVYYRSGAANFPFSGTGAQQGASPVSAGNVLTYTLTGLPDAETHYLAITAVDKEGLESPYSNIAESSPVTSSGLTTISQSGWSLHYVDSEDLQTSSAFPQARPATMAFDGDVNSMWHSRWYGGSEPLPHEIQINLGQVFALNGFRYQPRQDGGINGTIADYEFYVSMDGANWGSPVASGTFANNTDAKEVVFPTISGQYVRLRALREVNGNPWTSVAELNLLGNAVTPTNTAPVLAAIGNKTILESAILNFTVSATDADGDALTYLAQNLPAGASFDSATGAFSWIPGSDQAGSYSVTFSVSDGSSSDSETVDITVIQGNRAPIISSIGTKSIGEGEALNFTVSAMDPDNDALTYSADNLPPGASFNPSTRAFSWSPAFEQTENTRVYAVTFTVSDGSLSSSEVVTINVTNVNRPPVLEAIGPKTLIEGDSFNLVVNAFDPDGSSLTYSAGNLPEGAVFIPSTRSFSWIPDSTQAGTYDITFTVSDGDLSDSETVTLTVNNINEAPVLKAIGDQSVPENGLISFVVSASDPDNDQLTFSVTGLPAGATFDTGQQLFSWTPDFSQAGDYTLRFLVSDGELSDSEAIKITVLNSNQPPLISGSPPTKTMAQTSYSFAPSASDPDGDPLSFSIVNKPVWASFDTATGQLSGTPGAEHVGTGEPIVISVNDGKVSEALPAFSIEVVAYAEVDSDGDGVIDSQDAFPDDGSEWLDTDKDLIGNNADPDDDNDGVADVRDGFPLDASKMGWVITAKSGAGGYLTPEGETSVLYGGSQLYKLTPMAGYYVGDLLIDNVSIGPVESYQFSNIDAHHTIEAVFTEVPLGLSLPSTSSGLPGVFRSDGGDDSNNYVNGVPKLDIKFVFNIMLRDAVASGQRQVYLVLNGYRFPMTIAEGILATGARYTYTTRLGPMAEQKFHFVAEDLDGGLLWRYPANSELAAPAVELLDGYNVVGVPGDFEKAGLDSASVFNTSRVFRWAESPNGRGSYQRVDSGDPVVPGEGYVVKRAVDRSLPTFDSYSEIPTAYYEVDISPGWNLIANPYRGNVFLKDVKVRHGNATPVPWLMAVNDNLVVDGVFYYLGRDWGDTNAFESASDPNPAVLTPWIGYWVYGNTTTEPLTLMIPKPKQ